MGPNYVYNAVVQRVIDGDSLKLNVDLGFNTWKQNQSFRLLGCNARELSQPGGKEARDNLHAMLPVGTEVTVRSVKADKYGDRFDADISLNNASVVATLILDGWATRWDGQGEKPVPPWPRSAS